MYTIKEILQMQVAPALGCTEPVAIALCTAAAASLLKNKKVEKIKLSVDPNIYKNGMAVSIPGAKGGYGIDLACALGFVGGNPELKLEVLQPIGDQELNQAKKLVSEKKIEIQLLKEKKLHIRAVLTNESETAEAVIEDLHDNLTQLKYNEKAIAEHCLINKTKNTQNDVHKMEKWIKEKNLEDLVAMIEELDDDDYAFLQEGVDFNLHLAKYGLLHGSGLGVASTFERLVREGLIQKDMILAARILTSAASDARMSGVKMPAMSSAGSGNHGLTAILPIWAMRDYLKLDDDRLVLKAIALSHIITAYIKSHTGRLSAVCGCSVAAGAGATGGITYLLGGNLKHISDAIKNLIEDLAGVICDGAKASCALKLSTAAGTAVQSALFAVHGLNVKATDGIISITPEQTMRNIGQLSTEGMIETDRTILKIMLEKQFQVDEGEIS
ncbi:MAG: L-serine ammonia-lyase, iron-sulfur-dependent, subunit alpha [Spirochaetes bacterium]|nr:L-serine ammonia-lyase, iron-sulfur-dependent, subunit alpha [Spirochaetota bacterium]